MAKRRDPVAQYLARIGRKGGQARVTKGIGALDQRQRIALAQQAAKARWEAYYAAHPEMLKAKLAREAKKGTVTRRRPRKKALVKSKRRTATS